MSIISQSYPYAFLCFNNSNKASIATSNNHYNIPSSNLMNFLIMPLSKSILSEWSQQKVQGAVVPRRLIRPTRMIIMSMLHVTISIEGSLRYWSLRRQLKKEYCSMFNLHRIYGDYTCIYMLPHRHIYDRRTQGFMRSWIPNFKPLWKVEQDLHNVFHEGSLSVEKKHLREDHRSLRSCMVALEKLPHVLQFKFVPCLVQ